VGCPLNVQAVIFDLFGTLVPGFSTISYDAVLRAMAEDLGVAAPEFNRIWNGEMWPDRVIGRFRDAADSIVRACAGLGVRPSPDAVQTALSRRLAYERSLLTPFPDVVDACARLRGGGLRIGLISNCAMELVPLWHESDLARLFDVSILSAAVHLAKPDPRIYRLACEGLGVPPAACLYVGDGSDRELSGARDVGMRPVLVARSLDEAYDPERPDVDAWQGAVVRRIADVPDLLRD